MPDARTFTLEELRDLVRAEYQEMPGLCLTFSQMRKSWSLDPSTCDLLVDPLTTEGSLRLISEHEYVLGPAAWKSVVAAADTGAR